MYKEFKMKNEKNEVKFLKTSIHCGCLHDLLFFFSLFEGRDPPQLSRFAHCRHVGSVRQG